MYSEACESLLGRSIRYETVFLWRVELPQLLTGLIENELLNIAISFFFIIRTNYTILLCQNDNFHIATCLAAKTNYS